MARGEAAIIFFVTVHKKEMVYTDASFTARELVALSLSSSNFFLAASTIDSTLSGTDSPHPMMDFTRRGGVGEMFQNERNPDFISCSGLNAFELIPISVYL